MDDVTRLGIDLDVLTPKEREALRIALEPRRERGLIDLAVGSTPQSRCNARRRAKARLAQIVRAKAA